MSSLYDRAEIYDLLESEKRNEATRRDWQGFLGGRSIRTLLDVSIGTGGMTLPLQELGIAVCGSDLSEAMLKRCGEKAMKTTARGAQALRFPGSFRLAGSAVRLRDEHGQFAGLCLQ